VAETIAKQSSPGEKLVNDMRGRKVDDGEITAASPSRTQLMKQRQVSPRKPGPRRILAARIRGQGWGRHAALSGLKIGDVVTTSEDRQAARELATVKVAAAASV